MAEDVRAHLEPSVASLVPRFAALFDGRKDAYGVNKGGVRRVLPDERRAWPGMYWLHLEGAPPGIGIFPVRNDNTVKFAAIDLDEPNFDLAIDLAGLLPGHVWIERSRSGNAHIWTFFAEPVPAWAARSVLRAATFAAGRPEVEVFPKQAELREGMVGNYINLPYYGDERPMIWQTGNPKSEYVPNFYPYSLSGFLHDAEPRRSDPEEWVRRARAIGAEPPGRRRDESEFGTRGSLHVCATYMLEHKEDNPLAPGHRHVVLFNLAKMLLNCREYDESDALTILEGYNDASTAPLGHYELEQIVTNAARGGWTSTGCDDPLMAPYVSPDCPIAHA
jgi:hypothetical protein